MKIVTTSVDDFVQNLRTGSVFQKRVWYERSSKPLNGKTKHDATSFDVFLQLSAVLEFPDGQALLVCGVDCGVDRLTGDGEEEGSAERSKMIAKLADHCKLNDLMMMPGSLDQ